jgi:hypothetical protein
MRRTLRTTAGKSVGCIRGRTSNTACVPFSPSAGQVAACNLGKGDRVLRRGRRGGLVCSMSPSSMSDEQGTGRETLGSWLLVCFPTGISSIVEITDFTNHNSISRAKIHWKPATYLNIPKYFASPSRFDTGNSVPSLEASSKILNTKELWTFQCWPTQPT